MRIHAIRARRIALRLHVHNEFEVNQMWIIGIVLAAGAIIIALLIRYSSIAGKAIDTIAALAFFTFAVIAADVVRGTLAHDTVFMTEVHRVLLNRWFLASASYVGTYTLARLVLLIWQKPDKLT